MMGFRALGFCGLGVFKVLAGEFRDSEFRALAILSLVVSVGFPRALSGPECVQPDIQHAGRSARDMGQD